TGQQMNFLELRSTRSVPIAHAMYRSRAGNFGDLRSKWGVSPTEELHTSKQRHRAMPLTQILPGTNGDAREPNNLCQLVNNGVFPICKGEHFNQYDSYWGEPPLLGTTVETMRGKESRLRAASFFRLVFRRQACSTNERTVISNITCPGIIYFDSALPERDPWVRPSWHALVLVSVCNSYAFDWIIRQLVYANVTFNYLDKVPVPGL